MPNVSRRGFLLGVGATLATPMVVKAEILMPVRKLIVPDNNYLEILRTLEEHGVPIPSSMWIEMGCSISRTLQERSLREGFMRQVLDRATIDVDNVPRIRMRGSKNVQAIMANNGPSFP